VRTVAQQGKVTIESPLSPPACITAIDTYPPPAPTGLVAVGSGGGVSLIWEPVTAPDLAGYLVLRGVEGEALKPVNASPVTESTYRDTTAEPGVVYIYAVVAVDKATPANASPESNRVRESAR
jgi:fibronectin type 3 domain-containing protein